MYARSFVLSSVTSYRVQRLVKEQAMGLTRAIGSSAAPKAARSSSQWAISGSAAGLAAVALMHKNKSVSKTTAGAATIPPSMGTITTTVHISRASSPTATLASTSVVLAALLSHNLLAFSRERQRWLQDKTRSTTGLLHHLHRSALASGCVSPWRTVSVRGRCFSVVLCLDGLLQGCMSECCWSVHHSCVSGISNTYTLNASFFLCSNSLLSKKCNLFQLQYSREDGKWELHYTTFTIGLCLLSLLECDHLWFPSSYSLLFFWFFVFFHWWFPLLCPGWVNDIGKSHIL